MGTLVAAYFIGWAAITAYVGRLAMVSHRLSRRLHDLQAREGEQALANAR